MPSRHFSNAGRGSDVISASATIAALRVKRMATARRLSFQVMPLFIYNCATCRVGMRRSAATRASGTRSSRSSTGSARAVRSPPRRRSSGRTRSSPPTFKAALCSLRWRSASPVCATSTRCAAAPCFARIARRCSACGRISLHRHGWDRVRMAECKAVQQLRTPLES
jgi:hypothetical protein